MKKYSLAVIELKMTKQKIMDICQYKGQFGYSVIGTIGANEFQLNITSTSQWYNEASQSQTK